MARFGSLAWTRGLPWLVALSSATAAVTGCGGPATCVSGTSQACTCTDGRVGAQVCRADGAFEACVCEGVPDASRPDAFAGEMADASVAADGVLTTDARSARDAWEASCVLGTSCACAGDAIGYCEDVAGAAVCVCDPGPVPCAEDVDWLFLVDTSASMAEEQVALATELPRLVRILASGDANGDGSSDFTPVRSLHLGVITPDLGAGEHSRIPSCDVGWGDDGILRRTPAAISGCPFSDFPSGVFEFTPGGSVTPDDFAADFSCVAQAGGGGCGFEQQLEASLRALSPSRAGLGTRAGYVPPTFRDGSFGHADGANAGFVRESSVLALTLVTDEDDCSVPSTDLFVIDDPRYSSVGLNLRCSTFMDAQHATERYVDGLLGLRDHPGLLVYSAIAGIPDAPFASYDALLADPAMENRVDPGVGDRLLPVCTSGSGNAFPARRIVEVARGLERAGVQTSVSSICASNFESAVSDVVRALIASRGRC